MSDGDLSYSPPWKNAMAVLFDQGGYTFGDLISHEKINEAFGMPEPKGKVEVEDFKDWQIRRLSQMEALSDALLEERSMCLQNVVGQGYRIVEPEKQTAFAVKQGQKGLRSALLKMGRRLSFVDRSALTAAQAKENADAMSRLSFLNTQVGRRRISN